MTDIKIRVYVITYRRPRLLRRAMASLLAQTFNEWVCELHNDAPDDDFPRQLLKEIDDPRITLCQHSHNWGAVGSFNHAFAGGSEPYVSILEDDNWWEPGFLEAALAAIEGRPRAALVWANMRIWKEELDGAWTATGRSVWSAVPAAATGCVFRWPEALQAFDALHSQGAMLFRAGALCVPAGTPLAIIEAVRERAIDGELLLLPATLANFASTRQTARGDDRACWLQSQLLIAVSFFAVVHVDDGSLDRIWTTRRAMTPRGTNILFLTALALRRPDLVKPARWGDWLWFLLNFARHPCVNLKGLRFRRDHAELWLWLRRQTIAAPLLSTPLVLQKQTNGTAP